MKMFKRTITSMRRNSKQMILMFFVIFVLGNVLCASIAVKQSSDHVRSELRKRIPTEINVMLDNDKDYSEKLQLMETFYNNIKNDADVLNVDLTRKVLVNRIYDDFMINCFKDLDESILNVEIMEGRNFNQDDLLEDKPKIIVSRQLNKKVGDTFRLQMVDYKITNSDIGTDDYVVSPNPDIQDYYDLEIIGIFDGEKAQMYLNGEAYRVDGITSIKFMDEYRNEFENILLRHPPKEQALMLSLDNFYRDTFIPQEIVINNIRLSLKGMDALERLENEIYEMNGFVREYYIVKSSGNDYRYIQAPLENLVTLANVAMSASIFLLITLLSLISILFMRNRKHEIGILLALGERKIKVLGQFVCEILLVGLLAASCFMISGNKLGSIISKQFINIQIDVDGELQYQKENEGAMTQLDMINAYEVKITGEYITSIYTSTFLILLVSSGIPVLYILRMKPKEVLM